MYSNLTNEQTAEAMDQLHRALVDRGIFKTCLTCDHREGGTDGLICSLAKATPPPGVLIFGCEKWSLVPF